jgi:hypothetical protein
MLFAVFGGRKLARRRKSQFHRIYVPCFEYGNRRDAWIPNRPAADSWFVRGDGHFSSFTQWVESSSNAPNLRRSL